MQEFGKAVQNVVDAIFSGKLSAWEMAEAIFALVMAVVFLSLFLRFISWVGSNVPFGARNGNAPQTATKREVQSKIHVHLSRLINEKTVLLSGAFIIALMLFFPPYYIEIHAGSAGVTKGLGYGFVFSPPRQGRLEGRIDGITLIAQCIAVGMITALAWLAVRRK